MGFLATNPSQSSEDNYIRGHLLNEHLGGRGNAENMFPINGNANSQHLHSTEKHIETWLLHADPKQPKHCLLYEVKVQGRPHRLDSKRRKTHTIM
jgi:hypothetical protein